MIWCVIFILIVAGCRALDFKQGKHEYKKALEVYERPEISSRHFSTAIKFLKESLLYEDLRPEEKVEAHIILARCYFEGDNINKMQEHINHALEYYHPLTKYESDIYFLTLLKAEYFYRQFKEKFSLAQQASIDKLPKISDALSLLVDAIVELSYIRPRIEIEKVAVYFDLRRVELLLDRANILLTYFEQSKPSLQTALNTFNTIYSICQENLGRRGLSDADRVKFDMNKTYARENIDKISVMLEKSK